MNIIFRGHNKKAISNTKGFTLAELLVTVAIMGILAGISFVGVAQHQRNLKLTEMDNIAREIFVGAQNHLTQSKTDGSWDKSILNGDIDDESKWGNKLLSGKPEDGVAKPAGEHDYRRLVVAAGTANSGSFAFSTMLPLGSIDETVRTDGYYVIEYDILTAQVYAVFYTDQGALNSLNIDDIYKHIGDSAYRKAFDTGSGHKVAVGYYGGAAVANTDAASTASTEEELSRISAKIVNGPRLLLIIDDYNYDNNDKPYFDGITITLNELNLTGVANNTYNLSKVMPDGIASVTDESGSYRRYTYILDSVMAEMADAAGSQSRHFSRFGFTYGCNVYANVSLNVKKQTVTATTNIENSLFGSAAEASAGNSALLVGISNGRHLENLSDAVAATQSQIAKAKLLSNISWETGTESFLTGLVTEETTYGLSAGSRSVLLADGSSAAANKFVGISSSKLSSIDGCGKVISNMQIDTAIGSDGAGFLSAINSADGNVSIDSLTLQNVTVKDTADTQSAVGALCGSFISDKSLNISNVTIINPAVSAVNANASCMVGFVENGSINISNSTISADDTASNIINLSAVNGSAGSFIGAVSDADSVNLSGIRLKAQTVTVSTSGAGAAGGIIGSSSGSKLSVMTPIISSDTLSVNSTSGNAGGLIADAKILSSGNAQIKAYSCKANNFTISGTTAGGLIGAISGSGATIDVKGCNIAVNGTADTNKATVTGTSGNAGGLIGSADGGAIKVSSSSFNAGASGKVSGSLYAGGLAGAVTGSSGIDISSCFASSYVAATYAAADKEGAAGGFIGSADGNSSSVKITGCYASGRTKATLYESTDENKANITAASAMSVGGFAGIVKRAAAGSSINDCYTTSSVYRAASSGTFGIGGFVGTVTSAISMTDNYTTALITQKDGASTGAGCFAGEGGTNITADKNYFLNGVNKDITTASGDGSGSVASKASSKDTDSPFYVADAEQKKAKPFDTSLSTKYPYKTISQLTGDTAKAGSHVGDWPTGTDTKTNFEKQFAIIYYEIVQHGDKAKGTDLGYYYHGYAADPQALDAGSSYEFKEVYSDADGRQNNGKGLLTGHNEYVVESGYLLCLESDLDFSAIAVDSGWSQDTLKSMIDDGTAKTNVLVPYDSIADKIGIEGYKVYRINENNKLVENYVSLRKYKFDFTTSYTGYPGKVNWNNLTTFTLNPYFSDMLYPGTHEYGNVLEIRSAMQLSDQFNTGSKSYIGGWNDGTIEAVEQQMDISYSKDDVILTAYGEPLGDEAYVSPTLSQLRGTFRSAKQSAVDKDYYVLKHVTKTLVSQNNGGTITQLHITDLDVQDMSALVYNDESNISDITIDYAKSPVFYSTNGNKTIQDIHVKEFVIDRNCPYGLLINSSGVSSVIDNVRIDKITLGAVTIGADGINFGLVAGIEDNSKLSNCTISNVSDSTNTIYKGSAFGLIGENRGVISNMKLSDCTFSGNASGITNGFGIVGINGHNGGNNEFIADNDSTGVISNITFSNLRTSSALDKKVGIIGINYGKFNNYKITNVKFENVGQSGASIIGDNNAGGNVDSINVEGYTTDGNGFAGVSSSTISNSSIVNAQIAQNGFVGSSTGGTISGCHIYSDQSKYSANAYYAPNANTVDNGASNSLYGYNMVTIGLNNNGNPYNNSADIPAESYAGFIGSATGTTISDCSVTGKVFGKSASGFFDSIEGKTQISDCYANTVTSAFDADGVASGFGGGVKDSGTAVKYCHSVGTVSNFGNKYENGSGNGKCSGFISSASGTDNWNTASVQNCYAAIWGENASDYYPFFKYANALNCTNCCYMDVFDREDNVNTDNESYAGGKTSDEISADTTLGTTTGIQTVKYNQYNTDSSDSSYPYPINKTANVQYGDWMGTAAISLSVTDPAVLRVSKKLSVTAAVNPESKGAGLKWTIENPNIATIEASGTSCTITGVAAGSTRLTVRTADNIASVSYNVLVAPADSKGVFVSDKKDVTGLSFDVQKNATAPVTAILFDTEQVNAVQAQYTFVSATPGFATAVADTAVGASEYDELNKIFRTNANITGIAIGQSAISVYKTQTPGTNLAATTANVIYPVYTIDGLPNEWSALKGTDSTFNNVNINVKSDQDDNNVYIMFLQKAVNNQGNLLNDNFSMIIGNDQSSGSIKVTCSDSTKTVTDSSGAAISGAQIAGTAAFSSQVPYYCEISIPRSAIGGISPTYVKAKNWNLVTVKICDVGQ